MAQGDLSQDTLETERGLSSGECVKCSSTLPSRGNLMSGGVIEESVEVFPFPHRRRVEDYSRGGTPGSV